MFESFEPPRTSNQVIISSLNCPQAKEDKAWRIRVVLGRFILHLRSELIVGAG